MLRTSLKSPARSTCSSSNSFSRSSSSLSCSSSAFNYETPSTSLAKKIKRRRHSDTEKTGQIRESPPSIATPQNDKNVSQEEENEAEPSRVEEHQRYSRKNCPAHVKEILKTYFKNNKYPSKEERVNLAKLTNMNEDNIRRWFKEERCMDKERNLSPQEKEKLLEKKSKQRWMNNPNHRNEEFPGVQRKNKFPEEIRSRLEELFKITHHPSVDQKKKLAEELNLEFDKITQWFRRQNIKTEEKTGDKVTKVIQAPVLNQMMPDDEAIKILEQFFEVDPRMNQKNFIELSKKTGWFQTRIMEWFRIRIKEGRSIGKVFSRKSNARKTDQEFYFTNEIYKMMEELFKTKQFLKKTDTDLNGIVPLNSVETWFYRKRMETLDNFLSGKLDELPFQMKKLEECYSKLFYIEKGNLKKLSEEFNVSMSGIRGYFRTRRTIDQKAGKIIPERKKKQKGHRRGDSTANGLNEDDEEVDFENGSDRVIKREVLSDFDFDFDSEDDDVLEEDDFDSREEYYGETARRQEHVNPQTDINALGNVRPEHVSNQERESKNQNRPELPTEILIELEKENLGHLFGSSPKKLNTKLDWRFQYTRLPSNESIDYETWTNDQFLEFGSSFLSPSALEVLRSKQIKGSLSKRFVLDSAQFFWELNEDDLLDGRPLSFPVMEFLKVKYYLNILFSLVDPIDE